MGQSCAHARIECGNPVPTTGLTAGPRQSRARVKPDRNRAAKCERAATQSHATPFNDFLKALKLFLGLQGDSEGRAALHRAGIRSKGVGTRIAVDNVGAWSIKQG